MSFPDPPTYRPPTMKNGAFDPIWLQWFLNFSGGSRNTISQTSYATSPAVINGGNTNIQVILGSAPTSLTYTRKAQTVTLPNIQQIIVSPGDGVTVSFTGTLNVTVIPI